MNAALALVRDLAQDIEARDLCFGAGFVLLTAGLAQFSVPVAMIADGAILLYLAMK